MNVKNIFIIGTKHQYHQVCLAISHLNLNKEDVFLLIEDLGFDNEFHNVLKKSHFSQVLIFKSWIFKDLIFNPLISKEFIKKCKEIALKFNFSNMFISHYDSDSSLLANSILKPKNIFLLDEGTSSFATAIYRKNQRNKRLNYFIKSLLYGLSISLPYKIIYFTKYNLDIKKPDEVKLYSENIIENTYVELNENVVVFLGSSAVEVGLMNSTVYFKLLKKIKSYFKGKQVDYYPHRRETLSKLNNIEHLGFNVVRNEEPFENLFLSFKYMPCVFASLYFSGVLDNISNRYKNLPKLILFKFDEIYLLKDRDVYRNIYNHFTKNKFLTVKEISSNY